MNIAPAVLVAQAERMAVNFPWLPGLEAQYRLPPFTLVAVGSRETNCTNEVGDNGHGHGIWQLDDRSHQIPLRFDSDVSLQASIAARMLAALFALYKDWRLAFDAYNSGRPSDAATTGHDYGPDVLARRDFLVAHFSGGGDRLGEGTASPPGNNSQRGNLTMLSAADPKLAIAVIPYPEGGEWVVFQDGGVHAGGAARYFGSFPGLPESWRQGVGVFTDAQARTDGAGKVIGYTLCRQDGALYRFGADMWAAYQAGGGK
jgi:hypothetical protein